MRKRLLVLLASASGIQIGCSRPAKPKRTLTQAVDSVRIVQFYATAPKLARGEQELICYGVENAKSVWLSPPQQQLSAALSRCVEAKPETTTTYTLTAEGPDGKQTTRDLTVTVGAPRARILEVRVSTLEAHPGDEVSICYRVENVDSVRIDPIHFQAGARGNGCTTDSPKQTTTYVVTATGAGGDQDHERVTIKVR
jgi:hypothetical protein